jgi:hypothetical protein
MSSPTSSTASSPVHPAYYPAAPPDFDYLESLAKHSGHDALARAPSTPVPHEAAASPDSPPPPTSDHPTVNIRVARTYSGLEEGRPRPKRRPSVMSTLVNMAVPKTRRSSGSRCSAVIPSDLNNSRFFAPVARLRRLAGHRPEHDIEGGGKGERIEQPQQLIVTHVEGRVLFDTSSRHSHISSRSGQAPEIHP